VVKNLWRYVKPFWYNTGTWQTNRPTDKQNCHTISRARVLTRDKKWHGKSCAPCPVAGCCRLVNLVTSTESRVSRRQLLTFSVNCIVIDIHCMCHFTAVWISLSLRPNGSAFAETKWLSFIFSPMLSLTNHSHASWLTSSAIHLWFIHISLFIFEYEVIFAHKNLIPNRLTYLVHAKSTGELISFGFSDRSVRSLVSVKRSANRWVQTKKRLHLLANLWSQSEFRTQRKTNPQNEMTHCVSTKRVPLLSSSCFYHIRSFKQIRSSLDDGMVVSVGSSLVWSRPECTGKSRYLSASIHLSTLSHCITPKPPLATHWMASTFQTGHLGV